MPTWVTELLEAGVGAACLGAAVAGWRRGLRVVGAVFAIAGVAALAHAAWSASVG
jgi:hypothetical protein